MTELPFRPGALTALARGWSRRCPQCGGGRLFRGYLALNPACPVCRAAVGEIRADDAPPYFTIFAIGHIVVPLMLWTEQTFMPPLWLHALAWVPLTLLLALLLLPRIKGAVVGLMWSLRLKGQDAQDGAADHDAAG